jgi:hypothetical protein
MSVSQSQVPEGRPGQYPMITTPLPEPEFVFGFLRRPPRLLPQLQLLGNGLPGLGAGQSASAHLELSDATWPGAAAFWPRATCPNHF